jgi:hypothetical protein
MPFPGARSALSGASAEWWPWTPARRSFVVEKVPKVLKNAKLEVPGKAPADQQEDNELCERAY